LGSSCICNDGNLCLSTDWEECSCHIWELSGVLTSV
jgi:hypothetical protein